jgi:DNA-binding GntR family transcriptional regulator
MFSPVRHASLHSLIIRPLLHAIFSGQIPGGTHLVEQDLAVQFQVSRAPVREALREIASMGLVELRPNRGTVVLPFNPDSLLGIYHVRIALESEAARLAAKAIPATEIEAVEKSCCELLTSSSHDVNWSSRASKLDEEFHETVATWAGVARIAIEIRRYNQLAHLLEQEIRQIHGFRPGEQVDTINQHLAVIAALKKGDADEAARAMREHLLYAAGLSITALFPKI